MADASDLLAAELAAIRELVAERGRLLALVMNLDAAGRDVGKLEAAERGLAAWAPRLLAAVEAALKIHHDLGGRCARCFGAYGLRESWPCAEYRAISTGLLGEESTHG